MPSPTEALASEFKTQCIYRMNQNTKHVSTCFDQLDEADLWRRPNEASNSIGNLILHLCGNIRQYILASLGNTPDVRQRDAEFSARDGGSKAELLSLLTTTVAEANRVIDRLPTDALLERKGVQGFDYTGVASIIQVVEHYSYHTGQIAYWTKILKNRDLGFYSGVDLNKKNQSKA